MVEQILALTGLTTSNLIVASLLIFAGAYLKGFTGFGASMFWVTSLSFILPPVQVVPMVLMFEVLTSVIMLPSIWSQIKWNSILWLFIGTAIATPLGVYAIATLPADPIKLALAITVFVAVILILSGFELSYEPGKKMTLAVGGVAGILNGSMGIVGPPVILFYFSTPIGMAAGRASIIAFFVGTDTVGTFLFASQGLLTTDILWRTVIFLPILVFGVVLGGRGFARTSEEAFKKVALYVLIALSVGLGIQVLT